MFYFLPAIYYCFPAETRCKLAVNKELAKKLALRQLQSRVRVYFWNLSTISQPIVLKFAVIIK